MFQYYSKQIFNILKFTFQQTSQIRLIVVPWEAYLKMNSLSTNKNYVGVCNFPNGCFKPILCPWWIRELHASGVPWFISRHLRGGHEFLSVDSLWLIEPLSLISALLLVRRSFKRVCKLVSLICEILEFNSCHTLFISLSQNNEKRRRHLYNKVLPHQIKR